MFKIAAVSGACTSLVQPKVYQICAVQLYFWSAESALQTVAEYVVVLCHSE
jgi:hypothetical protein